jgi:cellulose synthase operon protein C
MEIPAADLQQIRDLYYRGHYRQALTIGEVHGPIRTWSGASSRLMAGRLAIQLGAPRLGHQLHLAAFREFPANLEAIYYHARFRLEKYGPLSAIRFMRQHDDWSDAPPGLRADWLAVQALAYSRLMDFDRAERLLAQAEAGAVDRAWIFVERSSVLEIFERYDEAMESARKALEIQPWFRPAVQSVAHLLHRDGKELEAIEFLKQADQHIEGGVVAAQLATIQYDLGLYADVQKSLDRYVELSPIMEADVKKWLDARRADVAYLLGDPVAAKHHAALVDDDFYTGFAAQLESHAEDAKTLNANRLVLPLDLAYTGKAPNALDLMGRYWKCELPATPEDAPTAVDGLPDASLRKRLDDAGWLTREFRLTPELAWELISRGLPFLITLVETGYGQDRIVFGIDRLRQSLFFAEGSERRIGEAPLKVLFERYGAFGPRGLLIAPAGELAKLDGVILPDATEHEALYDVQKALLAREFGQARKQLKALENDHPNHRLTKFAALAFARATVHPVLQMEACESLLADFPKDTTLILSRASAFRDLGRFADRRDVLAIAYDEGNTDPLLLQSLAQMYLPDVRMQVEAEQILRRSIRHRPQGAPGYFLLASQLWEHQLFSEALTLYRFACCLDDRESQFAEAYARAARSQDAGADALRLFQQRANRQALPYAPAIESLYNILMDRGDSDFALTAVQKAIEKTQALIETDPTPEAKRTLGDLLSFSSEIHVTHNRYPEADRLLKAAEAVTSRTGYLRSKAKIARLKPDFQQSLQAVLESIELDPMNVENYRLAATLMTDTDGRPVARKFLALAAARYPEHYGLNRVYAEFIYPDKDSEAIRMTTHLLTLCPRDAWALRQLALIHADLKEHTKAKKAIDQAGLYEPTHTSHYSVLAHVHRRADRIDEALQTFRECLTHHPDHELAIFEMIQLSRGLKEKKAALRYLAEQLHALPHTGDGLLAYHANAGELIDDPEERSKFIGQLETFLDDRPDLWQAWSSVIQSLANDERVEESLSLAKEATERFPLSARLWIDLSILYKIQDQPEEQIDALRQAVSIAPGWVPAVRELAEALNQNDRRDEALLVVEQMMPRAPSDPLAQWVYAEYLWDADRGEEAVERAKQAVRLDTVGDPRLETAWRAVLMWSDRLDRPEDALNFARELTVERPGDPRAWLRYARTINEVSQAPEIIRALDRAIELDPRNIEAYDLKAERLAMLGRFDEALSAAKPSVLAADMPLVLQGRAAWIEARRGNYGAAIPPMQALVAVDPDYIWGWQQLAEWYNDVGRPESYLEATSELMRMRPESSLNLMMRGDAKIQTGDREGGKADLREALKLNPGYSPAAVILFDSCLQDGEQREARTALAVLQEHLSGPEVLVKQIQFSARTGDHEGAARTFKELTLTPGEGPPVFLQMAMNEMARADLGEKAAELLREAWESGEEFHPWCAIFWLETPDGEQADDEVKLLACEALTNAYPEFISGHDRRAEVLCALNRYEDASVACHPPAFAPNTPMTLRGRAAWVEAQRGEREHAITLMKTILQEDADYSWGWRQLTMWYEAQDRHRDRLDAADHLVRLNPNDAFAHLIRGEARQTLSDNRGAREDFERAFEIDPDYEAAGLQLIGTQLETDDLAGAAKTLEQLQKGNDSPLLKLRSVQVFARSGQLEKTRDAFRDLLFDLRVTRGALQECLTEFRDAGWAAEGEAELMNASQSEAMTPTAAAVWSGTLIAQGQADKVADALGPMIERNREAGREAVLSYALGMTLVGPADVASTTVQRFAELLRQDDESWARAGSILVDAKQYDHAIAWLGDWQDRDGPEPWMLRILFDAYQHNGDDKAAEAIAQAVIDMDEVDDMVLPDFLAWLALYAVLRGDSDAADDWLDRVEPVGQPDGIRVILAFAEAILTVQRAANKSEAFTEAKQDLYTAAESCTPKDRLPGTIRIYPQVVARLSADTGSFAAKFWALKQRLRPWFKG